MFILQVEHFAEVKFVNFKRQFKTIHGWQFWRAMKYKKHTTHLLQY